MATNFPMLRRAIGALAQESSKQKIANIVCTILGIPQATLIYSTIQAAIGSISQDTILRVYDDMESRILSNWQKERILTVFDYAEQTFLELAQENEWNMNSLEGENYIDNIKEFIEGTAIHAMNESQHKKLEILGGFLGKTAYMGEYDDWNKLHHIGIILSKLSYRQIVLIKLMNENFHELNKELFVNDTTACVELNELLQYGFWQTETVTFGTNNSNPIQLKKILPSNYMIDIMHFLRLEKISPHNIAEIIRSLHLGDGKASKVITEEEYINATTWGIVK